VAAPARVAEVAPREATALAKAEPEWERRMQTGVTGSPSGASGSSTMGITSDDSQKPMKKGREGFACARRNEEGLLTAVFGLAHLLALASSEKLSDSVWKSLRRRCGRLAVRLARLPGVHAKIGMRALQDCSVRAAGTVAGSSTVAPRYATVEACSCGAG
jgi:hypothetical protein